MLSMLERGDDGAGWRGRSSRTGSWSNTRRAPAHHPRKADIAARASKVEADDHLENHYSEGRGRPSVRLPHLGLHAKPLPVELLES